MRINTCCTSEPTAGKLQRPIWSKQWWKAIEKWPFWFESAQWTRVLWIESIEALKLNHSIDCLIAFVMSFPWWYWDLLSLALALVSLGNTYNHVDVVDAGASPLFSPICQKPSLVYYRFSFSIPSTLCSVAAPLSHTDAIAFHPENVARTPILTKISRISDPSFSPVECRLLTTNSSDKLILMLRKPQRIDWTISHARRNRYRVDKIEVFIVCLTDFENEGDGDTFREHKDNNHFVY